MVVVGRAETMMGRRSEGESGGEGVFASSSGRVWTCGVVCGGEKVDGVLVRYLCISIWMWP